MRTSDVALLPYVEGADTAAAARDAARMARDLAAVAAQVESYGGVFLYVGVPNQYSVYRAGYPAYMDYVAEGLDAVHDAFFRRALRGGRCVLDMGAVFEDPAAYYLRPTTI